MSFSGRLSRWVLPACSPPGQMGPLGCRSCPYPHAKATVHSLCKSPATDTVPAVLPACTEGSFKGSTNGCFISPSMLRPTSGKRDCQSCAVKISPCGLPPSDGDSETAQDPVPSGLQSPYGEDKQGHFCHPQCH